MQHMQKFCLPFLAAMAFSIAATAQEVPISDGGVINDMTCSEEIILTDSGGEGGNYGPNESHTITLCVIDGAITFAQFVISPDLFGSTWDVDANASLFVYDGPNTGSPLIGEFNSITDPAGVYITGTGTCLTFTFVSGNASSGAGFSGIFRCLQPLQPFDVTVQGTPELSEWGGLPNPSMRICFNDSIIANAITNYPLSDAGGNGYEQSDETSNFRWDMGDGTIYQGLGLTGITHTYTNPFGYQVTLIVTDAEGQSEITQFFVLIAPRPDFSNLAIDDTLCVGEQTEITGGIQGADTVGVSPSSSAILGGGILGDPLFLPDGNDTNYETIITITDFEDGQVLETGADIINFCVNMEHSFLGDLEMMLTCPDGTSINIFNSFTGDGLFPGGFGGGGTFMGDANDSGPPGVPGIGFDYCFSIDAEWGTLGEEFAGGNTVPVNSFPPGGNAMASGTYQPEESFDSFIGCPLNGDWTLTIRDNLFIDDGWIFNWSIYFNPEINPNTIYYSPDIVEVFWEENSDIVSNEGLSIIVEPSQPGDNDFTFVAIDEFGCVHDTTIFVYVRPEVIAGPDVIACDLTHTLTAQNAPAGGEWVLLEGPNPTSTVEYEYLAAGVANITVNDYGIYTFQITEDNCGYQDESVIDFRPDPVVQPLVADTVLCVGGSFILDAGPQAANSGNFNINWTLNNSTFNTEDYAVQIDQTGQYIVTITGACGSASDTSNVVAIELIFEGDTLCGLETLQPVEVSLSPEGSGQWTSSAPNISFSAPNELSTFISSTQYGGYPVTFTDSRCPEDGLELNFQFVEQPTVEVLPQNPDFCVDLDSLIVTTNVTGNNTGDFFWNITGEGGGPVFSQNDSLFFPPESFMPLEVYTIQVQIFDNFGVCNVASGSMTFDGVWCTYNIPNVISPNGDGQNDRFVIEFMEYFPGTQLTIFNRWGNVVFDQTNYDRYQVENNGWDPEDLSEGVYFYELKVPQVREVVSGNLTIIR